MITVSENAKQHALELMKNENRSADSFIRVGVEGGGCSGFSYGFTLEEEQNEDDFVIEKPGVVVLVDSMSMQYLQGATIDYKEELMGSNFTINNPNATTTCGCGSSFAV